MDWNGDELPLVQFTQWEKHFAKEPKLCRVGEKGLVLPHSSYVSRNQQLAAFQARPDDVWVVTFPKSGTTWTQELVNLITSECDVKKCKALMDERFPYFEADLFYSTPIRGGRDVLDVLEESESPRLIKSHLPFWALPSSMIKEQCKVIYVIRNPKDVMVSFYYFYKMLHSQSFTGDFATFASYFMNNQVIFTPYWDHVMSFWEKRNEPNILIIHYEEMQRDFISQAKEIASFLDKPLSVEQEKMISEHCSFNSMKNNPYANKEYWKDLGRWKQEGANFMRKGEVGDWKNYFTDDLNAAADEWIRINTEGKGLTLNYTLN